jgi:hypothetical protein
MSSRFPVSSSALNCCIDFGVGVGIGIGVGFCLGNFDPDTDPDADFSTGELETGNPKPVSCIHEI